MSEWQVGDLALCVRNGPIGSGRSYHAPRPELRVGKIYTVEAAGFFEDLFGDMTPMLILAEARGPTKAGGFAPPRFRKVTPPKADEFDREVIEAMTGAPVGEPA